MQNCTVLIYFVIKNVWTWNCKVLKNTEKKETKLSVDFWPPSKKSVKVDEDIFKSSLLRIMLWNLSPASLINNTSFCTSVEQSVSPRSSQDGAPSKPAPTWKWRHRSGKRDKSLCPWRSAESPCPPPTVNSWTLKHKSDQSKWNCYASASRRSKTFWFDMNTTWTTLLLHQCWIWSQIEVFWIWKPKLFNISSPKKQTNKKTNASTHQLETKSLRDVWWVSATCMNEWAAFMLIISVETKCEMWVAQFHGMWVRDASK